MSRKIIIQSNCFLKQEDIEFVRRKFKADFEEGILVIPAGFSLVVYENDENDDVEVKVINYGTV